jgi:hypothetical protein
MLARVGTAFSRQEGCFTSADKAGSQAGWRDSTVMKSVDQGTSMTSP